ncbi:hypothetical protein [Phocaeicola plebeius]|jgi:hypothetical protein
MDDKKYDSRYDGETTDKILDNAKAIMEQTTAEDGETVQVYDTNGVPHKVSKTELLKKSTLALPALEDISSFVAVNAAGNAVGVMTKEQVASVLAELMNGNNLFPFMVKDFLYITNRNSIDELNDVVESGMYMIIPGSDTYGTLLVFQAGVGAAGATVQRYFHPSGLNITRIKNSNSENSWAQL